MHMKLFKLMIIFLSILSASCSGTDILDDQQVNRKIEIKTAQVALQPGGSWQVLADYYNEYGLRKEVPFKYTSSNTTAVKIDENGKITALTTGTAVIETSYMGTIASPINVNVVNTVNEIAIVDVLATKTNLKPSEKTQLQVSLKNVNGGLITGRPIEWFSENSSIITVNSSGEVTAVAVGVAAIHAKADGIKSNSIIFNVGAGNSDGTFIGAGGYQAVGTAILKENNGQLLLELSSDFKTSFALGTFVYLANSTNGGQVRSAGIEIEQIDKNGAHTFNITSKYPNVKINDYRYVIIFCKPASVTFGYADLR